MTKQEYINAMEQLGFTHICDLFFESPLSDRFDHFWLDIKYYTDGPHVEISSNSSAYDGYYINSKHYEAFMKAMRLTHDFLWEEQKHG